MTDPEYRVLFKAVDEIRARQNWFMELQLEMPALLVVCAYVQHSLRDRPAAPAETASARIARQTVAKIVTRLEEQNFPQTARLLNAGIEPASELFLIL